MATGVVKTFTGEHTKKVNTFAGLSVYENVTLYMSLGMTQTYNAGTGKSTLTFSDFKFKYKTASNYKLSEGASVVFGTIAVVVNGKTYTIFDGSGKAYRATAKQDTYGIVNKVADSSPWSYALEVDHAADGSLSVKVEWTGLTFEYNWNGLGFAIAGSETVALTKNPVKYTLTLSAGTGSTITVNRTSSPNAGAATGNLSSGATIYYGDVLKITFAAETGYDLDTHTVNGTPFTSGSTHTVAAAVTVVSSALVKSFVLTISADAKSTVTVTRTDSPLKSAATGELTSGSEIYYNDVLQIVTAIAAGYSAKEQTINGNAFESGASHTVTADVIIVVVTESSGTANIGGALYQIGIAKDGVINLYVAGVAKDGAFHILS